MKDRIRQIMESQHMTQQVFANAIGTTPATLSGIFNDRTRPTINIIESIKKKFPDISLEWLMFGQGEMYPQPGSASGSQATPTPPSFDDVQQPESGHQGIQSSLFGQEPMLDFGQPVASTPQNVRRPVAYNNGVRNTRSEIVPEVVKIVDKPARRVTEIRVYYDDQTWESFTPADSASSRSR